jgi:hypothetical protein
MQEGNTIFQKSNGGRPSSRKTEHHEEERATA